MKHQVQTDLQSALAVHQALLSDAALHTQLSKLAGWCVDALRAGRRIFFAGNGGSFADAQHLTAEFVSRLQFERAPLPAIALGANGSSMSAIGNDYGYEDVFARELNALGSRSDVFIPITTSGNSPNILKAVAVAQERAIRTMGLTGQTGGRLAEMCPCLRVPSTRTERIQECHILLGHILCGLVEGAYFSRDQEAPSGALRA